MASAEREPITRVWGGAHSGVQGQSPWCGVRGKVSLKLKSFCPFSYKSGAKVEDLSETI